MNCPLFFVIRIRARYYFSLQLRTGPHPLLRIRMIRSRCFAHLAPDQREEDAHNTEDGNEDEPDMQAGLELGVIRGGYLHGADNDGKEQHRNAHR